MENVDINKIRASVQSWATWQPNPDYVSTPDSEEGTTILVPESGSPGLFGPRSPRGSRCGGQSEQETRILVPEGSPGSFGLEPQGYFDYVPMPQSDEKPTMLASWADWQPNLDYVPTPQSEQVTTMLVPESGSPGLFGPRSPRASRYGGQ
ncbi:hypothetical protein B0H16DRAFT_50314 [Mycena metata]|uniref:Uncharacterized protein n=1 Tax=Mycena metata TaxID=1033252 RepID=A0AAD7IE62_9AGAR|nr:hypothetical protein B0H16DRAFT_50314 [Mycena metata]